MTAQDTNSNKRASRTGTRLHVVFAVFFSAMLLFVLGNAAAIYTLMSRYDSALAQSHAFAVMRTASQKLGVQAMRLSDGEFIQTAQLTHGIRDMENALQAIESGGVVDGLEVPPLAYAQVREHLPQIRRDWSYMHTRLRAITLGTYAHQGDVMELQSLPPSIQRQWLADDAANLLSALDAGSSVLMPLLMQARSRAMMQGWLLLLANMFVLLGLFVLLRRHFIRPVSSLYDACLDLAAGRYSTQISTRSSGEVQRITEAFNSGVRQIQQLLQRMQQDQQAMKRSDTIFQGLALNSMVGMFLSDQERFSFVSRKMAEIFGYDAAEMVENQTLMGIIVPRERYLMAEAIKASRARRDGTMRFHRHGRKKDGTVIDIEVFSTSFTVDGQAFMIGLVQDVTERKQAESSAQLAAIAYENSGEAIAITDAAGVIIGVNPAYSRMTGYWPDEVMGELLHLLRPGRHNRDFYDEMWYSINTRGRWEGEYWSRRKNSEEYAIRVVLDTAWNHDGSVNCRIAMLSDITEQKHSETEIWNQAHHDPLTGLPNRQYFNRQLHDSVQEAASTHKELALLFLDLDHFKEVNDSMGHQFGDQLLVQVAERLRSCVGSLGCFVARLGGDEFVILFENGQAPEDIEQMCETILQRISEPYSLSGKLVDVSASLGVAFYPRDATDAETLLRHVDMAMYAAKALGRNRHQYFDREMRDRARIQHDLLYALSDAIDRQQFLLQFQPVHSMRTGNIIKAEVLLRWDHPEFGIVAPMDFLPFAEEHSLLEPLGEWVMTNALESLAAWRSTISPDIGMAINVSRGQVGKGLVCPERLPGLMDSMGLPPGSLTLEFNEEALLAMDATGLESLKQLHDAGVNLSVQVVSISLATMLASHRLPLDALKIDHTATARLLEHEHGGLVFDTLILLAHRLGMRVIAHGVTQPQQYVLLREIGCDAGQGYLFDPPLDAEAFEQRLRERPVFTLDQ